LCGGYKTYTPNTAEEELIKKISQDALSLLENIESDFATPNPTNTCRLNGLANFMGMSDYSHPHFKQLTDQMVNRFASIKKRLQVAPTDLTGASFGPRYLILDAKSAVEHGADGVHCPTTQRPPFREEDLAYYESKLKDYVSSLNFDSETDFKSTVIHEVHHSAGGEHPHLNDQFETYTRKMHRTDFEDAIKRYQTYAETQPNGSVYGTFLRMTENPYNLVWMIGELTCTQK
jgi:hypothetical protein